MVCNLILDTWLHLNLIGNKEISVYFLVISFAIFSLIRMLFVCFCVNIRCNIKVRFNEYYKIYSKKLHPLSLPLSLPLPHSVSVFLSVCLWSLRHIWFGKQHQNTFVNVLSDNLNQKNWSVSLENSHLFDTCFWVPLCDLWVLNYVGSWHSNFWWRAHILTAPLLHPPPPPRSPIHLSGCCYTGLWGRVFKWSLSAWWCVRLTFASVCGTLQCGRWDVRQLIIRDDDVFCELIMTSPPRPFTTPYTSYLYIPPLHLCWAVESWSLSWWMKLWCLVNLIRINVDNPVITNVIQIWVY